MSKSEICCLVWIKDTPCKATKFKKTNFSIIYLTDGLFKLTDKSLLQVDALENLADALVTLHMVTKKLVKLAFFK